MTMTSLQPALWSHLQGSGPSVVPWEVVIRWVSGCCNDPGSFVCSSRFVCIPLTYLWPMGNAVQQGLQCWGSEWFHCHPWDVSCIGVLHGLF
jgi:hypothetical protein